MQLVGAKKAARSAVFAFTLVFVAGCESGAAAKPSLIPSLTELKPAIFCIDAALDESGVRECLKSQGIASDYGFPDRPISSQDFKRQALLTWAVLGRGGAHLTSDHFGSAMDYASCIEKATNALQGLEGEPKNAIGAGMTKAELSCVNQSLSVHSLAKRHPGIVKGDTSDLPLGEMKANLLARTFAAAAYRYVIEANGWVADEMRPCLRYLDGRPPSAGCAGQTERRAPAPPPSYPQK